MQYVKSEYSRSKIEKAGKIISEYPEMTKEFNEYIPVVDNWRAAHAYPLDVVAGIINEVIRDIDKNDKIKLVKRIKRLDSIVGKLKRKQHSGLYRMQDLGGCRVIVPQLEEVYIMADAIKNQLKLKGHSIDKIDNYIEKPRNYTGYRSYHIRVKFHEESTYDGMYIEVQIRTEQEHIWATSIEIMDAIANETLKAGTGNKDYMYFFKLVSALFAIEENTPLVEGIPTTKEEIMSVLNGIEKKQSIRQVLSARYNAISITNHVPIEAAYYILYTDIRKKTITITAYSQEEINMAIATYENYERKRKSDGIDVVLVSAKNFDTIRQCYPNYFRNTSLFLAKIRGYFMEYTPSNIFSTKGKGVKVSELFNATFYEKNIPQDIKIWNAIGHTEGDVVFGMENAAISEENYMRLSAIRLKGSSLPMEKFDNIYHITSPSLLAMSTGACYYIEDTTELITEQDCIVISCKENVSSEMLKFLLGWSKANICVWDLFNNMRSNGMFEKETFYNMEMPLPDDKLLNDISANVSLILDLENEFVRDYNNRLSKGEVPQIYIDDFNMKIGELLSYSEQKFIDYYDISEENIESIYDDLRCLGFYVYNQEFPHL